MLVNSLFLGLASFAAAANAVASPDMSLMESLRAIPEDWSLVGTPLPSKRLQLRIAMTQPNPELLEQTMYDIATPSHPNYGKHLRRDELKAMLRPNPVATESVLEWLEAAGVRASDVDDDGEWVNFFTTVQQAESMLNTTFGVYRNKHKNVDKIRTLRYSLPSQLFDFVDMIQPTTRFGQLRTERSQVLDVHVAGKAHTGLNVTTCNVTITPDCLKSLYKVKAPAHNKTAGFLAFNNFLEEYPRYADLSTFEAEYAPYMNGESFNWTSINGGLLTQNSTSDSVEANLDVQYALSVGYPVPGTAYSTGGRGELVPDLDQPTASDNENEPYLDFLTYILAQPDDSLPHTLTTSYGEDEQSVPEQYSRTVCSMFGQLGARGVSILFSSGDTGVASACQTNDGKNTTRFLPIFPAACPWVTSVGGTYQVKPEKAISFSSGGFSDRFPRPSYQDTAVKKYLSILGDRWDGLYNPAGRGFPDVAAQAYRYHVIDQGSEILVGGTSAASPTFAGVVALLNSARIVAGKSPLGFLNPFIYSDGFKGLNDITTGGSKGCTGKDIYSGLATPIVPYASWNATKGWDPVTGYGTPNYEKLLKLALKY
ncbi:hypothetical protein MBLNU459_g7397t1 [Dothideomycetes sp. NU459]